MKKRAVFLILVLLVAAVFTGCLVTIHTISSVGGFVYQVIHGKSDSGDGESLKSVNEYGQIVMDAFQNQDVKAIHDIMCPYIQENDTTMEDDIQEMFAFIDGNIISYDAPGKDLGGALKQKEYIWKNTSSVIRNIKTDTGAKYKIDVNVMEVHKKNRDYERVVYISIFDENGFDEEGHYKEDAIFNFPEMWENVDWL